MAKTTLVMRESDHRRFSSVLSRLRNESSARYVCLVDRSGQHIVDSGALARTDPAALASLAAGNVAATESLARLIGEETFASLYHEGRRESLHLSLVSDGIILLVVFDERSSLGLVRLRVEQHANELEAAVRRIEENRSQDPVVVSDPGPPEIDITDEDISSLFE